MTRRIRQFLGIRGECRKHLREASMVMARLDHPSIGYQSERLHRRGAEAAAWLAANGIVV